MHERKRQQFEELLKLVSDKKPADAGPGVQESVQRDSSEDTTNAE